METTRPNNSSEETGGSSWRKRSPRVIKHVSSGLSASALTFRSTTRCTTNRPFRENTTTSPGEISCKRAWWIETKSPGRMEGTMLVPETRRRTPPNVRTTSSASPHANSVEAFPLRPVRILNGRLRGFRTEMAAALRAANQFAARQRRDFEHSLESQRRRLIWFFSRCRLRYFLVRSVVVVQLSLPISSYKISTLADVALAVVPLPLATSLTHANINPGGGHAGRLCGEAML